MQLTNITPENTLVWIEYCTYMNIEYWIGTLVAKPLIIPNIWIRKKKYADQNIVVCMTCSWHFYEHLVSNLVWFCRYYRCIIDSIVMHIWRSWLRKKSVICILSPKSVPVKPAAYIKVLVGLFNAQFLEAQGRTSTQYMRVMKQ